MKSEDHRYNQIEIISNNRDVRYGKEDRNRGGDYRSVCPCGGISLGNCGVREGMEEGRIKDQAN